MIVDIKKKNKNQTKQNQHPLNIPSHPHSSPLNSNLFHPPPPPHLHLSLPPPLSSSSLSSFSLLPFSEQLRADTNAARNKLSWTSWRSKSRRLKATLVMVVAFLFLSKDPGEAECSESEEPQPSNLESSQDGK